MLQLAILLLRTTPRDEILGADGDFFIQRSDLVSKLKHTNFRLEIRRPGGVLLIAVQLSPAPDFLAGAWNPFNSYLSLQSLESRRLRIF